MFRVRRVKLRIREGVSLRMVFENLSLAFVWSFDFDQPLVFLCDLCERCVKFFGRRARKYQNRLRLRGA